MHAARLAPSVRPKVPSVPLIKDLALARPLGMACESGITQAHLFHVVAVTHRALRAEIFLPSSSGRQKLSGNRLP